MLQKPSTYMTSRIPYDHQSVPSTEYRVQRGCNQQVALREHDSDETINRVSFWVVHLVELEGW